jgi:hypothetical protein
VPVDNRCVDELVTILDDAERLDKSAPNARNRAAQMIDEYKRVLNRFRSKTLKESYQKELLRLKATLAPFLTR